MKEKKKILIIIGVILTLLVTSTIVYVNYCTIPIKLKQEVFTYEYGESIPDDLKEFVEITNNKKYNDTLSEFQLNTPKVKENTNFPEKGTYDCSIQWRKTKLNFKIEVKDTKGPEIVLNKEKVTIDYGESYDIKDNIKSVKDLGDGNVEYKTEGTVNNKKPGNYTIKVTATDSSQNTTTKEFTVIVNSKPSESNTKSTSSSYPMVYNDSTSKITVTKEWYKKAWCYIAHIEFTDYDRFFTACGNGKYGGKETIKHVSNRLNTILSVNGCYSAPRLHYGVVRKGVVYNNTVCNSPALYNSNTGILSYGEAMGISGQSLKSAVKAGKVTDTFCFGPRFLVNGNICNIYDSSRAQRTFMGTNGKAGDIWLVVSDGRYIDGVSAGLTYRECAQLLKNKGCKFGVPLDGGGSSTMVFRGKVLNKATGRAVVDSINFK